MRMSTTSASSSIFDYDSDSYCGPMHYRPQPAGFLTLVVEGPQAALAFERAFPTQFEKCRQAKLIQELGSSHTSLFPYRMALEEYPWVVNHELSEFMRRFVPASSRDSHWFYDVSDLDSFDYDNEEGLSQPMDLKAVATAGVNMCDVRKPPSTPPPTPEKTQTSPSSTNIQREHDLMCAVPFAEQ